mgnify:CR=1 FL=1
MPHPKSKRRRALTEQERTKIMQDSPEDTQHYWCVYLLTGLRRSELAKLPASAAELDVPAPFLRIRGKGDHERIVPLEGLALDTIQRLRQDALERGDGLLCPLSGGTLGERWRRDRNALDLDPALTLHSFRHDFATWLVNYT